MSMISEQMLRLAFKAKLVAGTHSAVWRRLGRVELLRLRSLRKLKPPLNILMTVWSQVCFSMYYSWSSVLFKSSHCSFLFWVDLPGIRIVGSLQFVFMKHQL